MADTLKPVAQEGGSAEQKQRKSHSAIGYPYFDLKDSLAVADAINSKGGGICDMDQLAAWLSYKSTTSGTFASRLASARYFGLIGSTMNGRVAVTERARVILAPVMPDDAINAKAEALLNVPLYKSLFDRFRGTTLPPDIGLRNLLQHTYKILPDRVQQAVRVFKDSAEQAGFFESAKDRLIRPSASAVTTLEPLQEAVDAGDTATKPQERRRPTGGGGDDGAGIHTAIVGMLRELPPPGSAIWSKKDQQAFLDAFTAMVKFIYPARSDQEKSEAGE